MSDNMITVVGNLTRDPELKYGATGMARATFGVAVARRRKVGDEWQETTSFFDAVCWRDLAEHVAESVTKGSRVIVVGRLEQREFTTKAGDKRNVVEIVADEVGASMRWSSVSVVRNERTNAPQRASGGSQSPAPVPVAVAAETYDDFGEEPF